MAEIELNPDFRDVLHELSAAGAELADEHNATRVFAALAAFGAPVSQHGVTAQLFASEGYGYRMGVKPNLVEILTVIDGVSFDEVWADRVETKLAGVSVPIMGRQSLLKNKRASAEGSRRRGLARAPRLAARARPRALRTASSPLFAAFADLGA